MFSFFFASFSYLNQIIQWPLDSNKDLVETISKLILLKKIKADIETISQVSATQISSFKSGEHMNLIRFHFSNGANENKIVRLKIISSSYHIEIQWNVLTKNK